ncbi:septum site-determining protein MinC [Paracoccus sp. (in: a-proteobacteria)]|uniref:septum site-determining protein MinC n=1 Tax=Paracoccus sp. TaxID=267 RepID=UPI00322019A1
MQATGTERAAPAQVASARALQIRGRFLTAIALHLDGRPDAGFFAALDEKLAQTPQFFENAPLVVDLAQARLEGGEDMALLARELRARRLSVFGVQNGSAEQQAAARSAGLILLPAAGRDLPLERVQRAESRPRDAAAPAQPEAAPASGTRLVTQPVRSGQTIFADRGDLVILGPVGSGAEVIATGNIHIYGRLRGRALAGVNGDESARIFCQALDAELVAIAGLYRTSENLGAEVPRQDVQIFLQGDKLNFEPLK